GADRSFAVADAAHSSKSRWRHDAPCVRTFCASGLVYISVHRETKPPSRRTVDVPPAHPTGWRARGRNPTMPSLTKQRTLLGMPVGRRRPDWPKVARYAAMGLGAVSTAAGGLRAGRQVKDTAKATTDAARSTLDKVGDAAGKASDIGSAITPGGGDGGGDREENLKKLRLIIKESIDVGVPLKTAYNQWTQFADM